MILPVTPVESMSRHKVPVRKPAPEVRVVMPKLKPKRQEVDVGFYYCPYVPEGWIHGPIGNRSGFVDYDVNALNLAYSVPLNLKGPHVDEQA